MNRLTESHFSFKCPMSWSKMEPSANGRFCRQCQKEVLDLTHCSLDEVRVLQQKHGSICGSIRIAQVAAVVISLSAAACKEKKPVVVGLIAAPGNPPTQIESPPEQGDAPVMKGEIYVPPPATSPHEESAPSPTDQSVIRGKICPMPPAKSEPSGDGNE